LKIQFTFKMSPPTLLIRSNFQPYLRSISKHFSGSVAACQDVSSGLDISIGHAIVSQSNIKLEDYIINFMN
jgi:hypothetical protein